METKTTITIHNVSENAKHYIVSRLDDNTNTLWYWGSWDNEEDARRVAIELGKAVVSERIGE